MPKFKVVLVMRQYQYISVDAKDFAEAKATAYDLWDSDKTVNGDNSDFDIYDIEEIAE